MPLTRDRPNQADRLLFRLIYRWGKSSVGSCSLTLVCRMDWAKGEKMKTLRRIAIWVSVLLFATFLAARPATVHAQPDQHVDVLTISGVIDTWASGYIRRGIELAERNGAEAVILVLDTPGGTLDAMQAITTRMLNARVPVVVFVAPRGAWAGSAGTFVTLAANVAAMAPGTTIGAAHPVDESGQNLDDDARTKVTNFSASMLASIARQRGRNAEWAVKAVRESIAATEEEALARNVIDLIADDLDDLLNQLDGRTVETTAGEITLQTQRVGVIRVEMNIAEAFFHTLVNPNIALILLSIGTLAITIELYNPGALVPAIVGSICLVLAFVALGNLPVNWGGVILILVSAILFIIDIKVNSMVLTVGELVIFVLGALLLFTPVSLPSPVLPAVRVSPAIILTMAGIMGTLLVFVLGAAVRARSRPVVSGVAMLIGATGIAVSDFTPSGQVQVASELWTAFSENEEIHKGDLVRVVRVEGLRLGVVKQTKQ